MSHISYLFVKFGGGVRSELPSPPPLPPNLDPPLILKYGSLPSIIFSVFILIHRIHSLSTSIYELFSHYENTILLTAFLYDQTFECVRPLVNIERECETTPALSAEAYYKDFKIIKVGKAYLCIVRINLHSSNERNFLFCIFL